MQPYRGKHTPLPGSPRYLHARIGIGGICVAYHVVEGECIFSVYERRGVMYDKKIARAAAKGRLEVGKTEEFNVVDGPTLEQQVIRAVELFIHSRYHKMCDHPPLPIDFSGKPSAENDGAQATRTFAISSRADLLAIKGTVPDEVYEILSGAVDALEEINNGEDNDGPTTTKH